MEPNRDQYNWAPFDNVYNFAKQNGILVKAHTLVWGSQAPGWINNLSPNEQAAEIEEWIRDFCERYPDIDIIDVVNEAVEGHAPAYYAQSAFGDDWITRSFELAQQYCPNAILVYNDFNFITWDTDAIMDLIRPAVEAGVIDALGLQAHSLYPDQYTDEMWTAEELTEKLDLISTMGLPLYVSEYDVQKDNDQEQLEIYQEQFPVFYEYPNVVGITLWGYQGVTWRPGSELFRNGQPRPAMQWLLEYLNQ